jgi:hypothetical protein
MKQRHAGSSIFLGLGLLLAALSCDEQRDVSELSPLGSREPSGAASCVPGETRVCNGVCAAEADGYQVCTKDGSSYGACACPGSGLIAADRFNVDQRAVGGIRLLPSASSGGDDLLGGSGAPLQGSGIVGGRCAGDSDCAGGLICFDIGDGLAIGGPAGGYCTRPCSSVGQCQQLDQQSACGTLAGQNLCIRLCDAGEPTAGDEKCLGRPDLTCLSLSAIGDDPPADRPELGICAPRCQSDAQCGGLRCDRAGGFCTIFPNEGLPIGATCSAGAQCAGGVCFAVLSQTERVCSAFCTLDAPGCGFDGSEPRIDAGCVLPQIPGESSGDQGLCLELCDSAGDCSQEGAVCAPGEHDGRAGVCVTEAGGGDPPPPAPDPLDAENLGKPCESDGECGGNLSCLTATFDFFGLGGGPSGGYCSFPCAGADVCPGDGVCARTSATGDGWCLLACVAGDPGACGRADLACVDIGTGACVPACTTDAGCGDRRCDVALGLCVDGEPEPECSLDSDCALGEVCDADAGGCVPAPEPECSADTGCAEGEICDVASALCVTAPPPPCSGDTDCGAGELCELETGACVTPPPPACSEDSDCAPERLCDLITGTCFLPATSCASDADCPGRVCNPSSQLCIDAPAIPIGGACSEDAECAGEFCASIRSSLFCSGICLLGTPVGCEPYGSDAFCLVTVDAAQGIGACLGLCNVDSDCAQPGYVCTAFRTPIEGRTGACLPPPLAAAPATP